jgi:hypothetical protein
MVTGMPLLPTVDLSALSAARRSFLRLPEFTVQVFDNDRSVENRLPSFRSLRVSEWNKRKHMHRSNKQYLSRVYAVERISAEVG